MPGAASQLPASTGMMLDQYETTYPDSPAEMASWVRDRSMKVVEELTRVVAIVREEANVSEDVQSELHFPVFAALVNAIKLAAFSSGYRMSGDELSTLVGSIYSRGPSALEELFERLDATEPTPRQVDARH